MAVVKGQDEMPLLSAVSDFQEGQKVDGSKRTIAGFRLQVVSNCSENRRTGEMRARRETQRTRDTRGAPKIRSILGAPLLSSCTKKPIHTLRKISCRMASAKRISGLNLNLIFL